MQGTVCWPAGIRTTSPRVWRSPSNVDGNNFGEQAGCDRWLAGGAPKLGGGCDFHRAGDGLARYGDREHRASRRRGRPACRSGRRHLGGERLSDRAGGNVAAARGARRNRRSSPDLSRGASAVHAGLAGLRVRLVVAEPAGGARAAGPRRQRHHEREHGAGSLRLSRPPAGPRLRPQRHGGRDRLHARPHHCLRHPGAGAVALAVRRQHSLRPGCDGDRAEDLAAHSAREPCLRFPRRAVGRRLSRPVHAGDRKCRASRAPRVHRDRAGRRRADRLGADPPAGRPSRRRCCRSTCFAGRCSRCRRPPRSARSRSRASPSSRCRSTSRTFSAAPRSRPASS